MSEDTQSAEKTVRVTGFSRRTAESPGGCRYAVRYIEEGEPGEELDWLDEFLKAHCENVVVNCG